MSSSLSPDPSTEPTPTKVSAHRPSTVRWSYSWSALPLPFYFWGPTSLAIPSFLRSISSGICIPEVWSSPLPQLMRSIMDITPCSLSHDFVLTIIQGHPDLLSSPNNSLKPWLNNSLIQTFSLGWRTLVKHNLLHRLGYARNDRFFFFFLTRRGDRWIGTNLNNWEHSTGEKTRMVELQKMKCIL